MQAFLGPDFDINEFPCSFNLSPTPELRPARLKTVEHTLTVEINNVKDCEREKIRQKNLLSFIYFHLDKLKEAVKLSNDLVELTQRRNVATLANRCFILWKNGDELEVKKCGKSLRSLKNEEDFHVLLTEAKAEQAYYYLRLGGPNNLMQAETLFSQVVNEMPTNYLWKYDLGLVCRRATHGDILSCSSEPVDLDALIKKAIQCFFEVADKGESWLKSMAYAELVNLRQVHTSEQFPQYDLLFRDLNVEHLVDRALDNDGDKIPSVLTQCGNALCLIKTDKSIELLEKSVEIKPSSRTYHYLGKSYKIKAQLQPITNKKCPSPRYPETSVVEQPIECGPEALQFLPLYSSDDIKKNAVEHLPKEKGELKVSLSEHEIIESSRKPGNQAYLNGDEEFVKKAVTNFKKAKKLSIENFPAILDLGILLNETGDTEGALQQFNKVTNSKLASKSHRVSAISAYEQAGLCYLELGKAGPPDNEDEEAGKRKLTQAVSLAAELALSMPELQGKTQELWTAFQTLMKKNDEEQSSPFYFKDRIQLLELAQEHSKIIDIFYNIPALTGNELSDKEIVTIAINSYHKESKFEDALALLSIISLRPDVRESDWWKTGDLLDLRIKSLLHAAAGRLERATDTPIGLFQQVFQLLIGACSSAQNEDKDNPQAGGYVGDVLVVFNDDDEVDDGPHSSTVTSLGLQQVATSLFGLETERNLKRSAEYGNCLYETQLQEMREYPVVMIVLGSEKRCPKFNAVLENVFVNIDRKEPTSQRILIIDAGLGDGQIPLGLTHYERFKLTNMSGLRCADPSPDNEGNGDELSYANVLQRGFNGDVNAVMELFCFMVGQKWPGS